MEQELQMDSCLFGGPPVRDDMIKLGESQIGFMNIFARPLFEAVTDILPAMRFAVDEILANQAVWESKIDDERAKRRKNPKLSLGIHPPSFSVDPTPSPFTGGPTNSTGNAPSNLTVPSGTKAVLPEEAGRRGSTGPVHAAVAGSRRSSLGEEKGSRRASAAGIVGQRGSMSREAHGSRRGSGDASLTAIIVTQTPNASDSPPKESTLKAEDVSQEQYKDPLAKSSTNNKDKDSARPVTAPSQARSSQGKHLSTPSPTSTSHQPTSQID